MRRAPDALSSPYTNALLFAALALDPGQRRARLRLAGEAPSPIDPSPAMCRFYGRCPEGHDRCAREMPVLRSSAMAHAGPPVTCSTERSTTILLAVNGTLMQGLGLNQNLLDAGATFVREATTEPAYRLWSIDDRHPAMVRVREGGASVAVEVWSVPPEGLASILLKEPPGLSIGKVQLADGEEVLGVLGEPILCEGKREITHHGGWRAYMTSRGADR